PGVARRPDAGAVDAAAAAVEEHAVRHDVDVLLPVVHHVVAEYDLAEPGSVDLHTRIAFVTLDGGRAAENHAAAAAPDYLGAHVTEAGINRDRFLWHARFRKCRSHAVRRPGLLRTGLEQQSNLHRDHGQPKRMHAGG